MRKGAAVTLSPARGQGNSAATINLIFMRELASTFASRRLDPKGILSPPPHGGGLTNLRLYAKGGSEMAEGSQICDLRVQPSRSEGGCDLTGP